MNRRVDELSDDEAVDMSPDMLRAAKEAEEAAKRAKGQGEDDDNDDDEDDFDLLGDSDDDDDSDDDTGSDGDDDDDDLDDSDRSDDEDDDADDDDPDDDDAGISRVPKVKKGQKSKKSAKDRIEELAEKRRDAEAAQFAAEMAVVEKDKAIENLTARLEALERGGAPAAAEKPDPSNFEYGEVDQKYIDAVVDWRVAQETGKIKKQQTDALTDAEKQRLMKHYETASNKAEAAGAKKYGDKFDVVKRTPFSGEVARAVLDSDHPVDISYYLARNVGKLRELTKMDSAQRAKALGRLEERFSARTSAAKKRTKAPDTPGRKSKPKSSKVDSKYGPDDQDEFDKAFWSQ